MSHRFLTQRALRRLSRVRRMRPGRRSIDISRLISPLRYDVVIRAQFLAELRRRNLTEVPATLPEFALNHPYFTWFKHVESARFFPGLRDDPELLVASYHARVSRAVDTLRSFDSNGFDLRHPVTVAETLGGALADSGVAVSNTLHIKDGCHRLALLLISGRQLEPDMYRLGPPRRPVPDNTARLLRHMSIPDDEYSRFLSHRFAQQEYAELSELQRVVAEESPERLAEFAEVVRVHHDARHNAR